MIRIIIHIIMSVKMRTRIIMNIIIRIKINIKMWLDTMIQMCYYYDIRNIKIRIETIKKWRKDNGKTETR